jgi:hypothetical protein
MAQGAIGSDTWGFRKGFVDLAKKAKNMKQ